MILIFSHPDDVHAQAVLRELRDLRAPAWVVDLGEYPQRLRLIDAFTADGGRTLVFEHAEQNSLDLASVRAAWWRRPQPYRLDPALGVGDHQRFALGECYEAMLGTLYALDVHWVNHPLRDDAAHRKLLQLKTAQEVGLRVPETLVTNSPEAAQRFVAARGDLPTVYKAFSATEQAWRETRLLRAEEIALLDYVRYAPVIFQEYVEAEVDLRITAVGRELFAGAIFSQETAYRVDFRMDMANARMAPAELPAEVEAQLRAFMARLGLVYGAIDMRRTVEGRHVFLEVNPAGQWLFIEQETGQPIARALAANLAAGGR